MKRSNQWYKRIWKEELQQMDGWYSNIIKSGKESLELSGKLMEIDLNTGVLKVYHNDKKLRGLIGKTAKTIIKDSKQLQRVRFKVPKQIVLCLNNMK